MTSLTGTSAVPSGTTIFASVPSSTASTSIVALSVSISAITSPGFTFSPSFFSHLARMPFSIVGDSAGIRMLIGMFLAQRAGGAGIGRRVHLGLVDRTNALDRLGFAKFVPGRVDARDMPRDRGDEHAPGLRIVERAAQRHVQRAIHDRGA